MKFFQVKRFCAMKVEERDYLLYLEHGRKKNFKLAI